MDDRRDGAEAAIRSRCGDGVRTRSRGVSGSSVGIEPPDGSGGDGVETTIVKGATGNGGGGGGGGDAAASGPGKSWVHGDGERPG
jgi:hypothetical protein